MLVLDTDIIISFLKGDELVKSIILNVDDTLATTIINAYELIRGATSINKRTVITEFIENINILDLNKKSIFVASEIYNNLKKKGLLIDELDILIASIVITNDATLFTYNIKHFGRIEQLDLLKKIKPYEFRKVLFFTNL